jgi:hypothetical protein
MYTVLTPKCTHEPFTDKTCQAYETPFPHIVATTNPHEAYQTVDITEKRREDSAEARHGVTETLAAKTQRAQQDHQEISSLHNRHPQEGEELSPSPHGKLI